MHYDFWYACKNSVFKAAGILVLSLVMVGACSSTKESTQPPSQNTSQGQNNNSAPTILKNEQDRTVRTDSLNGGSNEITLTYKNESSTVTIPIDPNRQKFRLVLNGVSVGQEDTTGELTEDELQKKLRRDVQQVMRDFRKAQDLFYQKEYKEALKYVNRSLRTQSTADALALKGTIFFMADNLKSARFYWNEAVKMNPEIPVPDIPELEMIIEDIKSNETEQDTVNNNQNEERE